MAISYGSVAGLNIDQNGAPYLNIGVLNLNSLNYDANGAPLLGMQFIAPILGTLAAVANRPIALIGTQQGASAAINTTLRRPSATVVAAGGVSADSKATIARPGTQIILGRGESGTIVSVVSKPAANLHAAIGTTSALAVALPAPSGRGVAVIPPNGDVRATIARPSGLVQSQQGTSANLRPTNPHPLVAFVADEGAQAVVITALRRPLAAARCVVAGMRLNAVLSRPLADWRATHPILLATLGRPKAHLYAAQFRRSDRRKLFFDCERRSVVIDVSSTIHLPADRRTVNTV